MFCRHPRLSTLPAELFEGLASFRDLEARIAPLPEELQRGDALEVFVEAYLQTQPLFQVQDLWLVGQIPKVVRKALNLPNDHKSIDGVFRTRSGTLVPYQVKFRIGRPQVGVREVSTFLGLTERAKDRLLISNSDRYAGDIENRDHLRILTGTYFDSLSGDELNAIAAWLKGRPARPAPAVPRPHQRAAIADITACLSTEDRATAVMACGTGKTLVGLRVAEAIRPKTALVLVPSLALLSQVLADWSRDTHWGEHFEYLCVCSDPSASRAADEWSLRTSEAPFPVETNPAVVRQFLSRPAGGKVRVIFSTYQSAPIVAKGQVRGTAFDFAIFDEAHKTAGPRSGTFAFALEDQRLRIRKRLFLTATPRKVNLRQRNRQGDFQMVSMEDERVYGRRAHEYTFARAVTDAVICDYSVVVATVDPAEVSGFAIKHGITLVQGNAEAVKWVATQVAVTRAIESTRAQKVITFHSRIEQAKHFASNSPRGIGQFLPQFMVGHVNGSQPVADRKETLSGFGRDQKLLVTNARCLTEGVDLPSVDMVVFNNPRKSKVDVVQAVGRAMRKAPGSNKSVGYIVIPVLLPPNSAEDLEAACLKTDWEELVAVLGALRDHDTRLDDYIRDQQIAVGRGQVFGARGCVGNMRVVGPQVSLETLQRHIAAIIVDRLGATWDRRFGELQNFKERCGHCNVPQKYDANPTLGIWLNVQRRAYAKGTLAPARRNRLESMGVVWNAFDAAWESQFEALKAFAMQHGHCRVPQQYTDDPRLGLWLFKQRRLKKAGKLCGEREARLARLGVDWDPDAAVWEQRFADLKAFKAVHGHCDVPKEWRANQKLGTWLSVQRRCYAANQLSHSRRARLEGLGVVWKKNEVSWDRRLGELKVFRDREGHCNVPREDPRYRSLAKWVNTQRVRNGRNALRQDRVHRLEELGFTWDTHEEKWDHYIAELTRFRFEYGHCDVSSKDPQRKKLARWLISQRRAKKRNTLAADRVLQLESLGVTWDTRDASWDDHFAALQRFVSTHQHCKVPQSYRDGSIALGKWVNGQRVAGKRGKIRSDRLARLKAVGFVWAHESQVKRSRASKRGL